MVENSQIKEFYKPRTFVFCGIIYCFMASAFLLTVPPEDRPTDPGCQSIRVLAALQLFVVSIAALGLANNKMLVLLEMGVSFWSELHSGYVIMRLEMQKIGIPFAEPLTFFIQRAMSVAYKAFLPPRPPQFYLVERVICFLVGTAQCLYQRCAPQGADGVGPCITGNAAEAVAYSFVLHTIAFAAVLLTQKRYISFSSAELGVPLPRFLLRGIDGVVGGIAGIFVHSEIAESSTLILGTSHFVMSSTSIVIWILATRLQFGTRFDTSINLFVSSVVFTALIAYICVRGGVASINERLRAIEEDNFTESLRNVRLEFTRAHNLSDITECLSAALKKTFPNVHSAFLSTSLLSRPSTSSQSPPLLSSSSPMQITWITGENWISQDSFTAMGAATESMVRCYTQRTVLDSEIVPGGLSAFLDWKKAASVDSIGRAITVPLQEGGSLTGTLHLFFPKMTSSAPAYTINHFFVRQLAEVIAIGLRYNTTAVHNSAKTRILNDLMPSHVLNQLAAEEAEKETRQSFNRDLRPRNKVRSPVSSARSSAIDVNDDGAKPSSVHASQTNGAPEAPLQGHAIFTPDTRNGSIVARAESHRKNLVGPPSAHIAAAPAPLIEKHENVSILVCDIVGYTSIAAKISAQKTMECLHKLYASWDELVERQSDVFYKVDTIGDSYTIAANLFTKTGDAARKLVQLAARLLERAEQLSFADFPIQTRIGIATGCVHGMVVGKIRRKYILVGPTMLAATRLESLSTPGVLHMTDASRLAARIRSNSPGLRERLVRVKDLGLVRTYIVSLKGVPAALEFSSDYNPKPAV